VTGLIAKSPEVRFLLGANLSAKWGVNAKVWLGSTITRYSGVRLTLPRVWR